MGGRWQVGKVSMGGSKVGNCGWKVAGRVSVGGR